MHTFELNGKTYQTDAETLATLRSIIPAAHESGDASAVQAVIALGEKSGRIVRVSAATCSCGHPATGHACHYGYAQHSPVSQADCTDSDTWPLDRCVVCGHRAECHQPAATSES